MRYEMGEKWRMLKQRIDPKTKYARVMLKGGRSLSVHRLILETFVGICPAGLECCHGDGSRAKNSLDNLRWDTSAANAADRDSHGRTFRGEQNHNSKLSSEKVCAIHAAAKAGVRQVDIASEHGVTSSHVARILKGQRWAHLRPKSNSSANPQSGLW